MTTGANADAPEAASPMGTDPVPSPLQRLLQPLLAPAIALLIAAVIGDLLILLYGESPRTVFRLLMEGTWGNPYGFGQVLYKTMTLVCTGLAFAYAARGGLFNVGAEGQLAAGGFAAAICGLVLPAETPAVMAVLLCTVAAVGAGALVGTVPGVLRARFGASEVIVTIMLNFVVLALLNYAVASHLAVPETLHTETIRAGFIPRIGALIPVLSGSAANWTILAALLAAVFAWWKIFRTRSGYALRSVGLQPDAAEYGGIAVGRVWQRALMWSGAFAGLGGINYVLGYKHYYEEGFAAGAGFLGIAVGLVGRNHPLGIILAALLFATLSQGGLAVNALVPKQLVDVLEAVVILAIATTVPAVQQAIRNAAARVRRRTSGEPSVRESATNTGAAA